MTGVCIELVAAFSSLEFLKTLGSGISIGVKPYINLMIKVQLKYQSIVCVLCVEIIMAYLVRII